MRKHGYRALPVVLDRKLVGIVSRGDVMKFTSNRSNLSVGGIMTKNVLVAKPDDDVNDAAKTMITGEVRQLPVVDGEVRGVITALDILKSLIRGGHTPKKRRVNDVMTTDVVYCSPDDDLTAIWDKTTKSGFSGLPVVSRKKVVGIITRGDLLKRGSFRISRESGKTKTAQVSKVMKTPPIKVKTGSFVADAGSLMTGNRIMRIPVVNDKNELVGIVDVEDILRAYVA